VIFTSGATEAINLALRTASQPRRRKVVTLATEHPAVTEPLAVGHVEVHMVGVHADGQPDMDALIRAIDDQTLLVTVSAANHEVGALMPLKLVAAAAHEHGALLHVDAAQAAGKVPLSMVQDEIDLMSISAHKFYGPQGVGALVARSGVQHRLRPLVHGGGQERGLRSGTLNVPGIVGLGAAAALARRELPEEALRLTALRDRLHAHLLAQVPGLAVNGPADRLPGNLNVRLPGVDAQALLARCPQVEFSTGSACASLTPAPSPVLMAMGACTDESIRLCVGRPTTEAEIDAAADALGAAAAVLVAYA
jgi:cysteine desulfurase